MEKKRIAVISEDLVEPWDEGIKNFARSTAGALGAVGEVLVLNVARSGRENPEAENVAGTRTFLDRGLLSRLRSFRPDFVLYVPSPSSTSGSFVRAGVLRRLSPRRPLGMVAMIPRRHGALVRLVIRALAPDVVFVPSYRSLLYLARMGVRGELLPLGVDPGRFRRVDAERKRMLRKKHGIGEAQFVFLHVGHLSRKRNLGVLGLLKREEKDARVLMVSSTSTPEDGALRDELESAGVEVVRKYVEIEEYYAVADCYVFPVLDDEGCIELPLSVLEALSSGLPVLATPFGGLKDFFAPGPDIFYWRDEEEFLAGARALRASGAGAARDMSRFSWASIASTIVEKMAGIDGKR